MTNDELDRLALEKLATLQPRVPAERAELEAFIADWRAQGGRKAQLAEEIREALRAWDDRVTTITAEYVRTIASVQESAS